MKDTGDYLNSTMQCENAFCRQGVRRAYMPYCDKCFRRASGLGFFLSRDSNGYRYDGRRWVLGQKDITPSLLNNCPE